MEMGKQKKGVSLGGGVLNSSRYKVPCSYRYKHRNGWEMRRVLFDSLRNRRIA